MSGPYTLRWGIVATGWISSMFVTDLLADPAKRGVSDVRHEVGAVASRSAESAEKFIKETWEAAKVPYEQGKVKAYGSYEELYADETIDVIYIGTPHAMHYQNAHDALTAGKHVLSEKSLVVTAAQAQALADLAASKDLFLMEAVWTRFQPITYKIQDLLASGVLGEICAVRSELGINWKGDDTHRMVNPDLAGGALLDVGPYSWTWLALLLLPRAQTGAHGGGPLPLLPVAASMLKHKSTGVDISTVATIQFARADGTPVHGTMHAAFNANNSKTYSVLVQCERGWLGVHWLPQRPAWFEYKAWDTAADYEDWTEKPYSKEERVEVATPEGMMGFAYEADEVARCVRKGRTESERMPVRESVLMLAMFDEIRRQGGLRYPDAVETLDLAK